MPGIGTGFTAPGVSRVLVVVVAWIAAIATTASWTRAARASAGLLGLGAAVTAGWWLASEIRGGVPTSAPVLLALGSACAALAALASATVRDSRPPRPARTALALLVLAVLVVGAPATVLTRAQVSSTAADDGPGAATDAGAAPPSARSTWVWQPRSRVIRALAAGSDVVVASGDGSVTALDARTGTSRWRYARPGARLDGLQVTPDGATVLAAFASTAGRGEQPLHVVVLEAATGRVRWQRGVEDLVVEHAHEIPTTSTTLPLRTWRSRDPVDATWEGIDLRTGRTRWRWQAPTGCTSPFGLPAHGRTVVLAIVDCADEIGVAGLDTATGHEVWRHRIPFVAGTSPRDGFTDIYLESTPDGTVALAQVMRSRHPVGPGQSHVLLDTRNGRVLASGATSGSASGSTVGGWMTVTAGDLPWIGAAEPTPDSPIEALDPATGRRYRLDRGVCPDASTRVTTTRTSFLVLCPGTGRPRSVAEQRYAGGAVTRAALPAPAIDDHDVELLPASGAVVVVPTGLYVGVPPVVGLRLS
jgi:hypothetical protein